MANFRSATHKIINTINKIPHTLLLKAFVFYNILRIKRPLLIIIINPIIYDIYIHEHFKLPFAHKTAKSENEHFLLFSDNTSPLLYSITDIFCAQKSRAQYTK